MWKFWRIIALSSFLTSSCVFGGEIRNLFRNPAFTDNAAGWERIGSAGDFRPGNGGITIDIKGGKDAGACKLQQVQSLKRGNTYRLCFTLDSEQPQTRFLVCSYRMRKKAKNLGVFTRFPVRKGTQRCSLEFVPGLASSDPSDPSVLSFYLGELNGKIRISDIMLVDASQIESLTPPFRDPWTLFARIDPSCTGGAEIPDRMRGPDGKPAKRILVRRASVDSPEGASIDLVRETGSGRRRFRHAAMLYNEFDSPKDQLFPIDVSADWWMELRLNGKIIYSTMDAGNGKKSQTPASHLVFLPLKKGRNVFSAKVLAGSEGWRFVWGPAQRPRDPVRFRAEEGYLPVDLSSPAIVKGSALDLSALVDAPAGKYGRATFGPRGTVVFERNPAPQRFFGFSSQIPENIWKTCSDGEFDSNVREFARAVRAQGYNLFRMHGIDSWLMAYSTRDKTPLPKFADRWDRIIAEFKKQGIYVQYNIFAFWLYSSEKDWFHVAEQRMAHKIMFILGRSWERERFAEMAQRMLNHVNPHTGLAWKDDPSFLAVEFYNELGLGIPYAPKMKREYPDCYSFFMKKWSAFLKRKYGSVPYRKRPGGAYTDAMLENPPIPVEHDRSPLRVDYDEFWYEHLKETYRFCETTVRGTGYSGLLVQCPMPALRCAAVSWEMIPVPDGHTYHCHPYNGEQPGSKVEQYSSIGTAAEPFRSMYGKRIYGRPFFSNEYNYVFRNPYQFESPLAYAAYAALNNWSSLAIHSNAVALKMAPEERISSFSVYNNPVLRAGEFLAAMLFLRGDVTPARHHVAVAVPRAHVFRIGNSNRALSPAQSRLGLLTDVAPFFPDLPICSSVPEPEKPDMTLLPAGSSDIVWHGWFAQAKENSASDRDLNSVVEQMRRQGILPPGNKTDIAGGVYQSETGELTLRTKENQMTLQTSRSEGAALAAGKRARLDVLEIRETSVNALTALTSVDGKRLRDSERMVLIYSTRAANTDMEHDAEGSHLRMIGTAPIRMQCGRFSVRIRSDRPLRCYALRINGIRTEELPLKRISGGYLLECDTSRLKHGPTPFFELSAGKE